MKYLCMLCAILFVCCAPAAAAVTYEYATAWGSQGQGEGQFSYPSGIAVDGSGNVYVADSFNYRVQKFTSSGEFVTEWGNYGLGDGEFTNVVGIAVDSTDDVYVSDKSSRIEMFSSDGEFLTGWGGYGTGDGQFKNIGGIAVDGAGNVYAADTGNNRIQKFSSDGTFTIAWGSSGTGNGQFNAPYGVAVDSAGTVFVADRSNHRIQTFTPSGAYTGSWTGSPDIYLNALWGIATGPSGSVFVTDEGKNLAWQFNATGTAQDQWGGSGSGNGQFTFPRGIAVDAGGSVYVVDKGNHRIEKFTRVSEPSADAGGPYTGFEGTPVTFSAAGSTGTDITTYEWDFDYDGLYDSTTQVPSTTYTWYNEFAGTIGLRVTDAAMRQGTDTAEVKIANVAPVLMPLAAVITTINEGDTFDGSGSFTDPGTDTWTATVDFGDGSGEQPLTLNADRTFTLSHMYKDNGGYPVNVVVSDGTDSGTSTIGVTVDNVAPDVNAISVPLSPVLSPLKVGTPFSASATFSDPGVLDTHTIIWDWSDGTTSSDGTMSSDIGTRSSDSGSVEGSHSYSIPGIYTVSIHVTDKDGDIGDRSAGIPVVVYDPNGGFATGGGWFTSPTGAYIADPGMTGKTNFAFVSKYKKDATVPESSVEFQFKPGNLNFKSTACEWLVIAGSKATYRGVGTVNGDGNYGFLLSAMDGSPDRVRVKIWDKNNGDAVVYDNQVAPSDKSDNANPINAIGGGSIVVHG
jgi:hypothetical protein